MDQGVIVELAADIDSQVEDGHPELKPKPLIVVVFSSGQDQLGACGCLVG